MKRIMQPSFLIISHRSIIYREKKKKPLNMRKLKLKQATSQYYDLELKQMIGHAYFERKEYDKGLPYLEDYVKRSDKVRREDLYELSYAYYMGNQLPKRLKVSNN